MKKVENQKTIKATMYNEVEKKELEEVVIYTKEIKEKKERKVKKYLPRLIDDLLGNLLQVLPFCFRGVQRIDHKYGNVTLNMQH